MSKLYLKVLTLAIMLCVSINVSAADAWGAVLFTYISTPMYDANETIKVEDGTIAFTSNTWGTGTFNKSTGEGTITMANHRTGGTSEYAATITGSDEEGYVISIPSVMGGTTITVTLGTIPAAAAVSATYTAGTYADCAYFQKYGAVKDQKLIITANDGYETVKITHTSDTWGTFTYDAATVTQNEDGSYTITAEEGNCAMPSMKTGSVTDYPSTFSGTVTDGSLVADMVVPGVMGGTTLHFNPSDFEDVYVETLDAWGAITFAYISTPMYDANEVIEISSTTIKFTSSTWGTATFDKTTGEGTITMTSHSGEKEYAATITGSADEGFVVSIPAVMGGTTINITIGTIPAAAAVSATYTAGTYADCAYFKQYGAAPDQKLIITANDGYETVKITHTSGFWGTFTYDAATVIQNEDGSYTITAEEGNCAMPSMKTGSVTDYPSTFSGTVTDGSLVADMVVPGVMGGTTLHFNPDDFEEVYIATGINNIATDVEDNNQPVYNLSGVRVDSSYKGVVIKGGKKYIQK